MSLVLLFICLWVFFFYVSFISFCCPFLFPIFACCSCPLRCSLTAPGSLQNMRREPRMARLCRCRGFKLQLWPCRTQSLANWLLQGVGSERMERWWSIIYSYIVVPDIQLIYTDMSHVLLYRVHLILLHPPFKVARWGPPISLWIPWILYWLVLYYCYIY